MIIRKGCKDVWNSYFVIDADYENDIPCCPNTGSIPEKIITWEEAVTIYNKNIKSKHYNFNDSSYITFNLDDYKFDDGKYDVWMYPQRSLKIIRHFGGIITPDYSTYLDMPEPIKYYNTYRMRAFGYWCAKNGIKVINNVRSDFTNNYAYCFCGIPHNSIVLIGTVASRLKEKLYRQIFINDFFKMIETLHPQIILVYGSANYSCFREAEKLGIKIVQYDGRTAQHFRGGK